MTVAKYNLIPTEPVEPSMHRNAPAPQRGGDRSHLPLQGFRGPEVEARITATVYRYRRPSRTHRPRSNRG